MCVNLEVKMAVFDFLQQKLQFISKFSYLNTLYMYKQFELDVANNYKFTIKKISFRNIHSHAQCTICLTIETKQNKKPSELQWT